MVFVVVAIFISIIQSPEMGKTDLFVESGFSLAGKIANAGCVIFLGIFVTINFAQFVCSFPKHRAVLYHENNPVIVKT